MSLINNVLRDLDKRRAGDDARRGLPNDVRPLPEADRKAPPWRLPAILAAGAAAIAGVVLWPAPVPVAVPVPAKPIATPPVAAPVAPAPAAAPAPATPVPSPQADASPPPPASAPAAPGASAVTPVPPPSTPAATARRGFQADVRHSDIAARKGETAAPPKEDAAPAAAARPAPEPPAAAKGKAAAVSPAPAEKPRLTPAESAAIGTLRLDSRL